MIDYSKRIIYALAMFFVSFSCVGFAAENTSYYNDSVRVNDLMGEDVNSIIVPKDMSNIDFTGWGNNEEIMKMRRMIELSKYGIENLTNPGSPIYDPAVLKTYGKVPQLNNENPAPVCENKLRAIRDDSWQEISFYPSGPVIRYGSDPERYYFLIELYDDGRNGDTYTEKDTRKIYDIVDKYATQNDIKDVPVVFILTNETKIVEHINFPVYAYYLGNGAIEESIMPKQSTEIIEFSAFLEGVNINKEAPALGVWESLLMILIVSIIWKRK